MGQVQGRRARAGSAALVVLIMMVLGGSAGAREPATEALGFAPEPSTVRVGAPITFTATIPQEGLPPVTSIVWSFGDGAVASGVTTAAHAYAAAGQYAVTLAITRRNDPIPEVATGQVTVYTVAPPAAFSSSPGIPNPGEAVAFHAAEPSDGEVIAAYAWDFGDGTTGSGPAPTHAYGSPGDQTVTLTVTSAFDGHTATTTQTVHVNAPPLAGFAVVPAAPHVGDSVTLYSLASDPDGAGDLASITWDLDGDGAYDDASGPLAQLTFRTAQSATVAQRVTDRQGAFATAFHTVEVSGASTAAASTGAGSVTSTTGTDRIRALKILKSVRLRLAGTVVGPLTTITSLSIVVPKGATIGVRCTGGGCAIKTFKKRAKRSGSLRLKALQREFRAGARITFDVTKTGYVAKRITLKFRTGRAPSRVERCLLPGSRAGQTKVAACPAS